MCSHVWPAALSHVSVSRLAMLPTHWRYRRVAAVLTRQSQRRALCSTAGVVAVSGGRIHRPTQHPDHVGHPGPADERVAEPRVAERAAAARLGGAVSADAWHDQHARQVSVVRCGARQQYGCRPAPSSPCTSICASGESVALTSPRPCCMHLGSQCTTPHLLSGDLGIASVRIRHGHRP